MRGVILAGGFGSRLNPATLVTNKHLLPIYSLKDGAVPMIFYPINTLKNSGITDILIITSRDHCGHMVQTIGDGNNLGVSISYSIQEMDRSPTGIAQALKLAEPFICDENFAVMLGDNFYEGTYIKEFSNFEKEALKRSSKTNRPLNEIPLSNIFVKEVHDPERFGVASVSPRDRKVINIVEKPTNPESNWAVTGLYLYTPHVFSLIPDLKPSKRGELEITDINNWYVHSCNSYAHFMENFWHDMGTPEGILEVQDFLS